MENKKVGIAVRRFVLATDAIKKARNVHTGIVENADMLYVAMTLRADEMYAVFEKHGISNAEAQDMLYKISNEGNNNG